MLNSAILGMSIYYRLRNALRNRSPAASAIARARLEFYEHVWRQAADELGAEIRPIGADIFEITRGARQVRVFLTYGPLDDAVTLRLAGHKPTVYRILANAGLPVPKHVAIDGLDFSAAAEFLKAAKKPVVVKPAYGTGAGSGVTTHISNRISLARALALSRAFCPESLVEEQVNGRNFRLLYLDGEILDCIERRSPSVIGDGKTSLRQLVEQENRTRANAGVGLAQALLPMDEDMKNTLAAQGLSLRSVPGKGASVNLKYVINGNRGADNITAMEKLSPALIQAGRETVRLIGVRLAGVDVIAPDETQDLREAGGAIIDVNTTPSFYFHYRKADGEFAAATAVLRRALNEENPRTYAAR